MVSRTTLLLGTALMTLAMAAQAQTGLLIVAHGDSAEWNATVRRGVAQVRWPLGPTALAFLMGAEAESAGWDAAVRQLVDSGSRDIVVVPLLISSYSDHCRQILYYAGHRDSLPGGMREDHDHVTLVPPPVRTFVTPALDDAPELGDALAARWRELDERDRGRPVVLVAHGPNDADDAARWVANLTRVAGALEGAGLGQPVRVGLIRDDAPPQVRAAAVGAIRDTILTLAARARDSVIVLPVLISSGAIDRTKLPRDLAELPIRYFRAPLALLPPIARWIERSAQNALRQSDAR